MPRSSRGTALLLLFILALSFFTSADASFFASIRQKLSILTAPKHPAGVRAESVVEKPKRVGKRVAVIGTFIVVATGW